MSIISTALKPNVTNAFNQAIANALSSGNPQKVLEGLVANTLIQAGFDLVSFNKAVGVNGEIGEIDVEIDKAIIEVTTQASRKLKQIQKLILNFDLNPLGKPVIPTHLITNQRRLKISSMPELMWFALKMNY